MRTPKPLNLHISDTEIENMQIHIYNECMKYKGEPSHILRENGWSIEDLRAEMFIFLMHFYPVQESNNYKMYQKYLNKKLRQTHLELEKGTKKKMKGCTLTQFDIYNEPSYTPDFEEKEDGEDTENIKKMMREVINEEITDAQLEDIYYDVLEGKRKNVNIRISYPNLKKKLGEKLLKYQEEKKNERY